MALVQYTLLDGAQPGPHLLITAGVHGDEFEPMVAVRQLASELGQEKLQGRLTLIPVTNEPAFVRASRTADDHLDLARTFPGTPDGSITERIAAEVAPWIRQCDFYVDLHTGGSRLRILPLSGYMLHADQRVLERQRAMAEAFNLPIVWGTSAELEGRSLSVARDAGVPAIYAEHGGGTAFDSHSVADYVAGCRNLMASLGMLDRRPMVSRVKYRVEDDRPQSGHLQICHPAPLTGLFVPRVQLGDWVERDQPLGTVSTMLDDREETVFASQTGLLIGLHTFAHVEQGTGLAILLDVTSQPDRRT